MTHKITVAEMSEYEFTQRMAGEHSSKKNKSLDVTVKGKRILYTVSSDRNAVLTTPSIKSAVDKYNSI